MKAQENKITIWQENKKNGDFVKIATVSESLAAQWIKLYEAEYSGELFLASICKPVTYSGKM